MKKNLPVTNECVDVVTSDELISTTDLKGIITSANDTFVRISGFSREELIGKSHNIVRHPDMPPAAFEDMWQHLKAGKHWMGMVKNRCKNGDHYWVDAYVTPIMVNSEVVGYESVRALLPKEQADRAEKAYKKINKGQNPVRFQLSLEYRSVAANVLAVIVGAVTGMIMLNLTSPMMTLLSSASASAASFLLLNKLAFKPLKVAEMNAKKQFNNPLMSLLYAKRTDELGKMRLSEHILNAKLRTVLARLRNLAMDIESKTQDSNQSLEDVQSSYRDQVDRADAAAAAMKTMSDSIQKVSDNASYAAQKSDDSDQYSQEGAAQASGAAQGIAKLTQAVSDVEKVISQLVDDTQNIGSVIDVIRGIAEQTNLLALNAAIEAARAGEQGRGFAVVADEVRTLAGRTQTSTEEINGLIEKLNNAVSQAVKVMDKTQKEAIESEQNVTNAIDSIQSIAGQVSGLSELNRNIAKEVHEQRSAAEGINASVGEIEQTREQVIEHVNLAMAVGSDLSTQAKNMRAMVERFKKD